MQGTNKVTICKAAMMDIVEGHFNDHLFKDGDYTVTDVEENKVSGVGYGAATFTVTIGQKSQQGEGK